MAYKYNNSDVGNVKYNGQQVEILQYNGVTVWENWKEYTGQLYKMTSNSWNGFRASTLMAGEGLSGSAYLAFDGNDGTDITQLNCNLGSRVRVDFPKAIKLRQIRYVAGGTHSDEQVGTSWFTWTIYGIKNNGTVVALHSNSSNNLYNTTPVVFNVSGDDLYTGIFIEKSDNYGWGWFKVRSLEVTKWVQKGS